MTVPAVPSVSANVHHCRTLLLKDEPSEQDYFSSDGRIGPHQRLAEGICELVTTEGGGRLVSVEGRWGSGKSTVTRLVENRLQGDPSICFFSFDAWSHTADPLRLVFLQLLSQKLISNKWLDATKKDSKWRVAFNRLSRRVKETEVTSTQKPTWFAIALATSLLFVPFGAAVMKKALDEPLTIDLSLPFSFIFLLGLGLTFLPVIVAAAQLVLHGFDKDSLGVLAGAKETFSELKESLTPDPTSIEFESTYQDLIADTFENHRDRKLLIVIDNLDRLNADELPKIWTTLQSFTGKMSSQVFAGRSQVCVLVPFDPSEIARLWMVEVPSDGERQKRGVAANHLLDKTFDARFELPLPIASDWKSYLAKCILEALPDHSRDVETISQCFGLVAGKDGASPRDVKSFVNQVGALHRQWKNHDPPIRHIAYYVLLGRRGIQVADWLLDPQLRNLAAESILGPNLAASLAGLAYNVEPARGLEILLFNRLRAALAAGDPAEVGKMVEAHPPAFWATVFGVIAQFADNDSSEIAQAIKSIMGCEQTQLDQPKFEVLVETLAAKAESVDYWHTADVDLGTALSGLVLRANKDSLISSLTKSIQMTILSSADDQLKGRQSDSEREALTLAISLGNALVESGFESISWKHGRSPETWLSNVFLVAELPTSKTTRALKPVLESLPRVSFVTSLLAPGKIVNIVPAVRALAQEDGVNFENLIEAAWAGASSEEPFLVDTSIRALLVIDSLKLAEESEVEISGRRKQLINLWEGIGSRGNHRMAALAVLLLAERHPNVIAEGSLQVNSPIAFSALQSTLESDDEALASELVQAIREFQMVPTFLQFVRAQTEWTALPRNVVAILLADPESRSLVPDSYIIGDWPAGIFDIVNEYRDGAMEEFLRTRANKDFWEAVKREGLSPALFSLYLRLSATNKSLGVFNWLLQELSAASAETWSAIFESKELSEGLWELILAMQGLGIDPGPAFTTDSVDSLAARIIGSEESESLSPELLSRFGLTLPDGLRVELFTQVVSNLVAHRPIEPDWLARFEPAMIADSTLFDHPDATVFFREIVDSQNIQSLNWLSDLLGQVDKARWQRIKKALRKVFFERLQRALVEMPEDAVAATNILQPLIARVKSLG